jgi:hypothetical protein
VGGGDSGGLHPLIPFFVVFGVILTIACTMTIVAMCRRRNHRNQENSAGVITNDKSQAYVSASLRFANSDTSDDRKSVAHTLHSSVDDRTVAHTLHSSVDDRTVAHTLHSSGLSEINCNPHE